jgi:pimeloyl-ACP methyl ester carboxylesterase
VHIYLIPAMGCDARVYDGLQLDGYETTVLKWTEFRGARTLAEYAYTLSLQIKHRDSFALVGVSMGGLLAMELSLLLNPKKVILISSARGRKEFPGIIRFGAAIAIHKLPAGMIKFFSPASVLVMGVRSKAGKKVYLSMLRDTDAQFLKFCIAIVATWNQNVEHENSVHFHGDKDRTLPLRNIKNRTVVKGLGHASMLDDWSEVQALILQELAAVNRS